MTTTRLEMNRSGSNNSPTLRRTQQQQQRQGSPAKYPMRLEQQQQPQQSQQQRKGKNSRTAPVAKSTKTTRSSSLPLRNQILMLSVFLSATMILSLVYHSWLPSSLPSSRAASSPSAIQRRSRRATREHLMINAKRRRRQQQLRNEDTTERFLSWFLERNKTSRSEREEQQRQVVKKDKNGKELYHHITKIRQKDLRGIGEEDRTTRRDDHNMRNHSHLLTIKQARKGREPLLAVLEDAGVREMDAVSIAKLPLWDQVRQLYYTNNHNNTNKKNNGNNGNTTASTYEEVIIHGLDTCRRFRRNVPAEDASIGVAGLFNTGTNPLAMYLEANCIMPHNSRDKHGGMRWQVPWGKHTMAKRKWNHTAGHDTKVNKTNVLPVVLIRDPYSWMQSMCRHPYAAKWNKVRGGLHCPNLVPNEGDLRAFPDEKTLRDSRTGGIPVMIDYPGDHEFAYWPSLVHLWSDWYDQYLKAKYPRLIVRFEDLIFRPKPLIAKICACAGAVPKQQQQQQQSSANKGKQGQGPPSSEEEPSPPFLYVVDAAKWGPAHHSSNLISAMIKYGTDRQRFRNMTEQDLVYAGQYLDLKLMKRFQYQIPPPIPNNNATTTTE